MIVSFDPPYDWLSNFTPCPILYDGRRYSSVEHTYMSAKSADPAWKDFCANAANSPGKVKRKSRKINLRADWETVKVGVMKELLYQKFRQRPFKNLLLNTREQHIQEGNTWGDEFWGVDLTSGEGENQLGLLIMEIREALLREEKWWERLGRLLGWR